MNNNDNNIEILDDFDFDLETDLGITETNDNIENQEKVENENLEKSQFENIFGPENIVNEPDNTIEQNVEDKKEPENNPDSNNEKEIEIENNSDSNNEKEEEKEEIENPMIEIVNNKQTMTLILIMLVVLFIAVFFMPKFFELING